MNLHVKPSIDPVCLRKLDTSSKSHELIYRNVTYRFCSVHCLERFAEIPEFFTAPRNLGDNQPLPKQHRLRFCPVSSSILEGAIERLQNLQGITQASLSEQYADLAYDLRLVGLQQIEAVLTDAGVPLRGGIHRLFRSFWHFSEHNELSNLACQPFPCCSQPPVRIR